MTIADTLVKSTTRSLVESALTLSDTIIKSIGKNPTESVTVGDSLARQLTLGRILTESVTIADSLVKSPSRLLTDAFASISDTLAKRTNRALSDSGTVTDDLVQSATRVLSDTVTMFDGVYKHAGMIGGNFLGAMGYATGVIYYQALFFWEFITQATRPSQRQAEIVLAGIEKETLYGDTKGDIVVAGVDKDQIIGGLNG